jgi:hypothetical protein
LWYRVKFKARLSYSETLPQKNKNKNKKRKRKRNKEKKITVL